AASAVSSKHESMTDRPPQADPARGRRRNQHRRSGDPRRLAFLLDRAELSSVRSTRSCSPTLPGQVNGSLRPRQVVWLLLGDVCVERLIALGYTRPGPGILPRVSEGQEQMVAEPRAGDL